MAKSVFTYDNERFNTAQDAKDSLNRFFGNTVNSFGVRGGKCLKWVKLALRASLGWVYERDVNLFSIRSAWNFFTNVIDSELTYYDYSKIGKENNFSNADLKNAGTINGSIVFGFYSSSSYLKDSIDVIETIGSEDKKNNLIKYKTDFAKKKRLKFNPISHVGIFYNDQFFHVINSKGVTRQPTPSFYPVAYWNCIDLYIKALEVRDGLNNIGTTISDTFSSVFD